MFYCMLVEVLCSNCLIRIRLVIVRVSDVNVVMWLKSEVYFIFVMWVM